MPGQRITLCNFGLTGISAEGEQRKNKIHDYWNNKPPIRCFGR